MVSVDKGKALQETLFWLSQPNIHPALTEAEAEADIAAGRVYDEAQVRAALNLPVFTGPAEAFNGESGGQTV